MLRLRTDGRHCEGIVGDQGILGEGIILERPGCGENCHGGEKHKRIREKCPCPLGQEDDGGKGREEKKGRGDTQDKESKK